MTGGKIVLLLSGVLLVGCIQFPTQYERIEADRVRLLDFVYEPPEAAPGDTVAIRAVFAGKPLLPEDLTWRVSWKVVKNAYGTDTSFEEQPLPATVEKGDFSKNTGCVVVRFVVPEECIAQSPMVQDDWMALLPGELRAAVPAEFASLSKEEMLGLMDSLAAVAGHADAAQLAAIGALMPDLVTNLPLVMQLLTVPVRIFADIKGAHRIQSDYTVSYTPKFARWPGAGIFENTNPHIDSVGVYKVDGEGLMRFDPAGENTEYIPLSVDGTDTARISVDKGFTYFVAAFTGRRDTVLTLGDMMQGKGATRTEEHTAEWLFQMHSDEIDGLSPNDLMNAASLGDLDGILLPPRKRDVKHFTLWVQVTDSKLGVLNRSQGSALTEVHGVFDYTDAYINQFKK